MAPRATNGRATQTKPKLLNNVILAGNIRVHRELPGSTHEPQGSRERLARTGWGDIYLYIYTNKTSNKTRQLWPACKLQNQNQVRCPRSNISNEQQSAMQWLQGVHIYQTLHLVTMKEGYVKVEQSHREGFLPVNSLFSVQVSPLRSDIWEWHHTFLQCIRNVCISFVPIRRNMLWIRWDQLITPSYICHEIFAY